jgi:DNA replication protein DnaC
MQNLQYYLTTLRLSGMAQTLELRAQEARSNQLDPMEFLELILQDELHVRDQRLIERRNRAATFRDQKTLESFDFSFNAGISRKDIYDLASGHFLDKQQDILFIGPSGVGKSHLVQAIGQSLIKLGKTVLYRSIFDIVHELLQDDLFDKHERIMSRYLKCDLLIIDDMGIKQLPPKSGEYLFEIIMRRYETKSTIMTSNRPIEDWGKLIGDMPAATAILDRFLHHAIILKIKGRSYRMKDKIQSQQLFTEDSLPSSDSC